MRQKCAEHVRASERAMCLRKLRLRAFLEDKVAKLLTEKRPWRAGKGTARNESCYGLNKFTLIANAQQSMGLLGVGCGEGILSDG